MVFKIFGCLVKEKIIVKFLLATLKTLTNSKDCSSPSLAIFSSIHDIAGFRNTFQIHRRLSRVTGGFLKVKTSFLKKVTGRIF
jgi:hypothetical protein